MYTLRYSIHDTADGKQVEMQLEIDYDNTSNFIEVGRWKDPKPLSRAQVYKLNMEMEELSML
jgi:hypothetical protein